MRLSEALQECTLALLRRIAANHAIIAGDDLLRGELAEQIVARLGEPGYLASYVAGLSPEEKQVLLYLSAHDWQGKAFMLERQFSRQTPSPGEPSLCLGLLQKGLLFRTYGLIDSWRGEVYHIPDEPRPFIEASAPTRTDGLVPRVMAAPPPDTVEQRDGVLDVFCLLSFLRRGERRAHQGFISRNDLPRLEQECSRGSSPFDLAEAEKRWRFIVRLCLGAGWAWRDGTLLKPGRAAVHLLEGRSRDVRQRLLDRYLKDRGWSDLAETGKLRQPLGSRRIDETAARQMLLHHLEEMVGTTWTTEDVFCEAVRSFNPDFLREDYASLGSAVVNATAEAELYGQDSWMLVEGEWIRYVLRGPLYWLGVVRWGKALAGGSSSFQLVAQGDDGAPGSLVFRNDCTVFAPHGCRLGLLYRLEPYLIFRGADTAGRSYRFTEASIHQGMESGGSLSELLRVVESASGNGIPDRVSTQIREWAASYGRLTLEAPVLLTATTEDDLEDASSLPAVASCLGELLGHNSRRVLPHRFWHLLTALREAGRPPRLDPTVGSTRARSVTGDPVHVRECLFALLVLRSLYGQLELEAGEGTQRTLELVLGPEAAEEVSKRAQEAVRKIRSVGDGGW